MSSKTKTIQVKVKEVEPKLYTMLFDINGKYHSAQYAAHSLEEAVEKTSFIINFRSYKPKMNELWWHFHLTIADIQVKFKNVK